MIAKKKEKETKMVDIFKTEIEPAGHLILVLPDELPDHEVDETTEGGIYFAVQTRRRLQEEKDREQAGVTHGVLVKIGPNAWKSFDDGKPWASVGDKVCFARYAGFEDKDESNGLTYQLMNDEDIKATRGAVDVNKKQKRRI